MRSSGISHIFSIPFHPIPAKERNKHQVTNAMQLSTVRKIATLKIDTSQIHPLDFYRRLKGKAQIMVRALHEHIQGDLGRIEIEKMDFKDICRELLESNSFEDAKISEIKIGLKSCLKMTMHIDKIERYSHFYNVYLMLEAIEEQTWALEEKLDIPLIKTLVNKVASTSNPQVSDASELQGIIDKTLRNFLHYEKYCRFQPQPLDMHTRINELFFLLKVYDSTFQNDDRFKEEQFWHIERLFTLATVTTKESKEIDFFVYDKGMLAFFDFLEAVTEMKIPMVSDACNVDFLKNARREYKELTFEPRAKAHGR